MGSSWLVWEPRDGLRSLRPLASTPSVHPSAPKPIIQPPHNNSFIKHFSNFIKILRDFGHPSFKSLAAYKNNKNVTDSFSKFFFPSKGPTEDIILIVYLPDSVWHHFHVRLRAQSPQWPILIGGRGRGPRWNRDHGARPRPQPGSTAHGTSWIPFLQRWALDFTYAIGSPSRAAIQFRSNSQFCLDTK